MTAEQFHTFWADAYSDTPPLSHYFKHEYRERWFRIHSLPESKRYASNQTEWKILLDRQNEVITDLLGEDFPVLLVTGEYQEAGAEIVEVESVPETTALRNYFFSPIEPIDLHQIDADSYDAGQTYQACFSEQHWCSGRFDDLLRAIADDELRAFFVSVARGCIVAPYDGGVDFILKDTSTRNFYWEKYKAWLSARPDGL